MLPTIVAEIAKRLKISEFRDVFMRDTPPKISRARGHGIFILD